MKDKDRVSWPQRYAKKYCAAAIFVEGMDLGSSYTEAKGSFPLQRKRFVLVCTKNRKFQAEEPKSLGGYRQIWRVQPSR